MQDSIRVTSLLTCKVDFYSLDYHITFDSQDTCFFRKFRRSNSSKTRNNHRKPPYKPMRLLINKHLFHLDKFLPEVASGRAEVEWFDPEDYPHGCPTHARDFDAMFINTTTKIHVKTLPDAGRLRFIGTGSAGFDHVDTVHLEQLGVAFSAAPGCNARSVAEYVLMAVLTIAERWGETVSSMRIGVIGAGHTGCAVQSFLESFGFSCVMFDPPREEREQEGQPTFHSASREELMSCDLITLHTPLTFGPSHPTFHLLDDSFLLPDATRSHYFTRDFMHDFLHTSQVKYIVQASRGGVADESALLRGLQLVQKRGRVDGRRNTNPGIREAVVDVWENEPLFSDSLAEAALFATPHIAGYSVESKLRASKMIADACRRHAGSGESGESADIDSILSELDVGPDEDPINPNKPTQQVLIDEEVTDGKTTVPSLRSYLMDIHPMMAYDRGMRELIGLGDDAKRAGFYRLRTEMPFRREFTREQLAELRVYFLGNGAGK